MSNSALCPAVVEIAVPRKKPNKKLIINKDNRRQGFKNNLLKLLAIASNKLLRRVFCINKTSHTNFGFCKKLRGVSAAISYAGASAATDTLHWIGFPYKRLPPTLPQREPTFQYRFWILN